MTSIYIKYINIIKKMIIKNIIYFKIWISFTVLVLVLIDLIVLFFKPIFIILSDLLPHSTTVHSEGKSS